MPRNKQLLQKEEVDIMEKAKFLLSVVFQLHKLNNEWTGYRVQNEYCHRYGFIEVDRENIDELGELVGSKLISMAQELNATFEAKDTIVIDGKKRPDAVFFPTSHSLVRI